jgi:hypothetical protein
LRRHLSFANVTAALALFIALGGTGYAASRVPRRSVGPVQLQTNAVTASKIRANAVGASEIRSGAVGKSEVRTNAVGSAEIRRDGVGGAEIRRGAVGSDEIRNGRIASVDVADGAIGSPQLKDGGVEPADLSTATRNAFQGATLRAAVNAAGELVAGNAKSATPGTAGVTVTFDRDVSGCFYSATPVTATMRSPDDRGTATVASGGGSAVLVKTFNGNGVEVDEPFHLIVVC